MGRADHPGLPVGKQDRLAIRGQDRQGNSGGVRDQPVGFRAGAVLRAVNPHHIRRMHLMDRGKHCRLHVHCLGHARAIDGHDL